MVRASWVVIFRVCDDRRPSCTPGSAWGKAPSKSRRWVSWGDKRYWRYEEAYGPRDVIGAFEASVAAGLDLFDTAEVYGWGKSEKIVGALARRSEANVVIATKYAPLSGRGGARAIHKGLAGSLKRLGLQRVDLYQLHWADFEEVSIDDAMSAFAEIVHAGQASAVGVSNFRAAEIGKHMPP